MARLFGHMLGNQFFPGSALTFPVLNYKICREQYLIPITKAMMMERCFVLITRKQQ